MDVLFMKATELIEKIRENLKDYPIDYLKRKATDEQEIFANHISNKGLIARVF